MMLRFLAISALAVSAALSCTGDGGSGPESRTPAVASITAGADQSATVGAFTPTPISVLVTDARGRTVVRATVTFAPVPGSGFASPTTVPTNEEGIATANWRLGTTPGPQRLNVRVGTLADLPVSATAIAGPAARVVIDAEGLTFDALQDAATIDARLVDAFGNTATGTITFATTDSAIARVDPATGRVTAIGRGSAYIRASTGNAPADSLRVTVTQRIAALVLAPNALQINALGRRATISATATDRNGFVVTAPRLVWRSLDAAIASVDTAGIAAAVAPGSARIVATADDLSDTTIVTVAQIPAALALTATASVVAVGGSTTLTTVVVDSGGATIEGPPLASTRFAALQPSLAAVDALTGVVSGIAPGLVTFTAIDANDPAIRDSVRLVIAGPQSVIATATSVGANEPWRLTPGSTVTLPVRIDLSRPSPTGDLGALQLTLRFDPAVLRLDSAQVAPRSLGNLSAPGEYRLAHMAIDPAGTGTLPLGTLHLTVLPSATPGTDAALSLEAVVGPTTTMLASYSPLLMLTQRIRVR
jgi:hypothetical protein